MQSDIVLHVEKLSISIRQYAGLFSTREIFIPAIKDMSFDLHRGEFLAVAGASGSGKSLLAHSMAGILPYNARISGKVAFHGEGKIGFIPQDTSYIDPLMKTGNFMCAGNRKQKEKAEAILAAYNLDASVMDKYPFELSGGMLRRVFAAAVMMQEPALIVADEPTPGLDAAAANSVLESLRRAADDGRAVLVISHDISSAVKFADRIIILYGGKIIEDCPASGFATGDGIFHPYTRALREAMAEEQFAAEHEFAFAGEPDEPDACPFYERCHLATGACARSVPLLDSPCGFVRCLHSAAQDDSAKRARNTQGEQT